MIRHACFAHCDFCGEYLGQLWALPVIASDLLPAPDFHVCDDCFSAADPACVLPDLSAVVADFREAG